MKVSGLEALEMAKAPKSGQMVLAIRVLGRTIEHMGQVHLCMLMGIYMREIGLMIKLMDSDTICMSMELDMKGIGKMTCNMDMVKRHGQMDQYMKVSTSQERNKVSEVISGRMVPNTRASGMRTR